MSYGLTSGGIVIPTYQEVRSEIAADFKTRFGTSINTTPQSRFGILIDQQAEREFKLWQQIEAVYASQFWTLASGAALDNAVVALGISRLQAANSTVAVTLSGTPGTVIASTKRVSLDSTGTLWSPDTSYTIGGGGTVSATLVAVETGPLDATLGDSFTIETPVFGWSGVTITANAEVGRNIETDSELRARAAASLTAQGGSSVEAILADLLAVDGVTNAGVVENATDTVDIDGRPPHSFEAIVSGGVAADIALSIWNTKPAGIATFGNQSTTVTDSQGNSQTILWSRPTDIDIYVDIDLTMPAADYPGDTAVKNLIIDYGTAINVGDDVRYLALQNELFDNLDNLAAMVIRLSTVSIGAAIVQNISIAPNELANFTLANIAVNETLT